MKRILDRMLARLIRRGQLHVNWSDGTASTYGDGSGTTANLRFRSSAAERRLAMQPELALGECYMDGTIEFPDDTLLELIILINQNWDALQAVPWIAAIKRARILGRWIAQNNNVIRARKNVAHHYDLDERLYRLFLDEDMQYSCAYFETSDASIEEAQWAKKRHIAAKLDLRPGQQVLDIGSGWGGLGLYLADATGVDVTGVTLSTEQHRVSNERARQLGLAGHVRFELKDYRALDRRFDRIVSVGMFEHVGATRYDEFFRTAADLLNPDGVMLLHSIGRSEPPGTTNPWIAKYIFPGGYIPALSEVLRAIERSDLYVTDVEILRMHYAETLRAWRERFRSNWAEAARLYDERFCRMWDFYLTGSEATFRAGGYMVFQIQLTKDMAVLPLTRDYMFEAERQLNAARHVPESMRLAGE